MILFSFLPPGRCAIADTSQFCLQCVFYQRYALLAAFIIAWIYSYCRIIWLLLNGGKVLAFLLLLYGGKGSGRGAFYDKHDNQKIAIYCHHFGKWLAHLCIGKITTRSYINLRRYSIYSIVYSGYSYCDLSPLVGDSKGQSTSKTFKASTDKQASCSTADHTFILPLQTILDDQSNDG